MKKLSNFPKQILLIVLAVITVAGAVYAAPVTPFTNGFIRDVFDGGAQFIYGHGVISFDGNPGNTVYGYGYGFDFNDRNNNLPGVDYADYGFENHAGAATIDNITATATTITVDFSTDYLAKTYACYKGVLTDICSNLETDFSSGSRTVTFENLDCGTNYDLYVNTNDAGGNKWSTDSVNQSTDSCSTPAAHHRGTVISGPIIAPKTELSNGSHTPASLIIPDIILHLGSVGNGVQQLQTILNYFGTFLAPTGAGSPGNETQYFGQRTFNALKNFQKTFGLEKVDGIYGEQTKAMFESFLN